MFKLADCFSTKDVELVKAEPATIDAETTEPSLRMIELAIEDLDRVGGGVAIFQF